MQRMNQKPFATDKDVREILTHLYELQVLIIEKQESYSNQVFYVVAHEEEYILILHNQKASQDIDGINEEIQLMGWLNSHGVICPKPIKNIYGNHIYLKDLSKQEQGLTVFGRFAVRLQSFVKGTPLNKIVISDELLFKSGYYLAELQLVLKNVDFPIGRIVNFSWNLESISKQLSSKHYYAYVEDESRRTLVTDTFETFVKDVHSRNDEFEKGAVHGDFNDGNVLVNSSFDIAGIIDFGDVSYNALIYDTAIALLYMMMLRVDDDMMSAGGYFLAGYQSKRPLTVLEKEVIIKTAAARMAQSLINGLESYFHDPESKHVLNTQRKGWESLNILRTTPEKIIWEKWKTVANTCCNDYSNVRG